MLRPRILVLIALVVGAAALGFVLLRGSAQYTVTADFVSASQLVKGNLVKVSGEPVGKVKDLQLTDDSRARVTFTVDKDYAPLREGTRAIVRQSSLSGVANRYIDLQLGGADRAAIRDGGRIETASTESAVDLDQLFNTFDPKTREGTRRTIKLFSEFNAGREDQANAALRYLNPALASSSRLFDELNRNRGDLERFIVQNSRLVTDLASRDDDLAGLVSNLGTTMNALASRRADLGQAVDRFPGFMRRANTTFVNLRSTLDALDPLVRESKPIVRTKLRPLFAQLRPFARDAVPTIRDLRQTIRQPGEGNDLIELLRAQPAVDQIANQEAERNGKRRPGAFKATQQSSPETGRQLAYLRAYAPELVGWFDDFSHSGAYDALGGFSRSGLALSSFTLSPTLDALPQGSALRDQIIAALPPGAVQSTAQALIPVPPNLNAANLAATAETRRNNRCPGALEKSAPDGGNPFVPSNDFECNRDQKAIGR